MNYPSHDRNYQPNTINLAQNRTTYNNIPNNMNRGTKTGDRRGISMTPDRSNIQSNYYRENFNNYNSNSNSKYNPRLLERNSSAKKSEINRLYDNGNTKESYPQKEVSQASFNNDYSTISKLSNKSMVQAYLDRRHLETQQKLSKIRHEKFTQESSELRFKPLISENSKKIIQNLVNKEKAVKLNPNLLIKDHRSLASITTSNPSTIKSYGGYYNDRGPTKLKYSQLDDYKKIAEKREQMNTINNKSTIDNDSGHNSSFRPSSAHKGGKSLHSKLESNNNTENYLSSYINNTAQKASYSKDIDRMIITNDNYNYNNSRPNKPNDNENTNDSYYSNFNNNNKNNNSYTNMSYNSEKKTSNINNSTMNSTGKKQHQTISTSKRNNNLYANLNEKKINANSIGIPPKAGYSSIKRPISSNPLLKNNLNILNNNSNLRMQTLNNSHYNNQQNNSSYYSNTRENLENSYTNQKPNQNNQNHYDRNKYPKYDGQEVVSARRKLNNFYNDKNNYVNADNRANIINNNLYGNENEHNPNNYNGSNNKYNRIAEGNYLNSNINDRFNDNAENLMNLKNYGNNTNNNNTNNPYSINQEQAQRKNFDINEQKTNYYSNQNYNNSNNYRSTSIYNNNDPNPVNKNNTYAQNMGSNINNTNSNIHRATTNKNNINHNYNSNYQNYNPNDNNLNFSFHNPCIAINSNTHNIYSNSSSKNQTANINNANIMLESQLVKNIDFNEFDQFSPPNNPTSGINYNETEEKEKMNLMTNQNNFNSKLNYNHARKNDANILKNFADGIKPNITDYSKETSDYSKQNIYGYGNANLEYRSKYTNNDLGNYNKQNAHNLNNNYNFDKNKFSNLEKEKKYTKEGEQLNYNSNYSNNLNQRQNYLAKITEEIKNQYKNFNGYKQSYNQNYLGSGNSNINNDPQFNNSSRYSIRENNSNIMNKNNQEDNSRLGQHNYPTNFQVGNNNNDFNSNNNLRRDESQKNLSNYNINPAQEKNIYSISNKQNFNEDTYANATSNKQSGHLKLDRDSKNYLMDKLNQMKSNDINIVANSKSTNANQIFYCGNN